MTLSKALSMVIFGRNSDFHKIKIDKLGKSITLNYSTNVEDMSNEKFSFLFQDGLVVSLVERIKKLEFRVAELQMKQNYPQGNTKVSKSN